MSERYELEIPDYLIMFEVNRLRRDHSELHGELSVKCGMPGAQQVNGKLTTADFNFSSLRARQDRAKLLQQRARTNGEVDWFALLEEFCEKVFDAERIGDPAVDLRTLPRPAKDDEIYIEGLVLPRRHPSILFGDGGTAKSYTALWLAGQLARTGCNVVLFDWELSGEDHRDRLERLFGSVMPKVLYCRCERPLTHEADRLARIVRESKIDYALYDSVAFACAGRPEDAEVAGQYFRAVREINCGSLHIAHVNKSEDNDRKPFGSSFWHNGARSTWYCQATEAGEDGELRIGIHNRKSNLGALRPAVSYAIGFSEDYTTYKRIDVSETPEIAAKTSVRSRMFSAVKKGALTPQDIALKIDADVDTVTRYLRRYKADFVLIDGGRYGRKERQG